MITLLLGIIIFLQMIEYIVLADIILSWLMLLGVRIRPAFMADILDPIYNVIRKYIPTRIGPFEFTAIIVILILVLIRLAIVLMFPEVSAEIENILYS